MKDKMREAICKRDEECFSMSLFVIEKQVKSMSSEAIAEFNDELRRMGKGSSVIVDSMMRKEFDSQVEQFCGSVWQRAMAYYDHSVEYGRMNVEEVGPSALRSGLVGAVMEHFPDVISLCADMMDAVNESEVASYLRGLK